MPTRTLITAGVLGTPVTQTVTTVLAGITFTRTITSTPWATPPVYSAITPHGVWLPEARTSVFSVLQCPSDRTNGPQTLGSGWGMTSYLANWNVLGGSNGDGSVPDGNWGTQINYNGTMVPLGWYTPSQRFATITDGLSQTIFFGEGYGSCDGRPRIALYSAAFHNSA